MRQALGIEKDKQGWFNARAPYGELLPLDLRTVENEKLSKSKGATLYAVGANKDDYQPELPPLVLVHGYTGHPAELEKIAREMHGKFQVYVLAYPDDGAGLPDVIGYGRGLANELKALKHHKAYSPESQELTIVAHSMGGLVSRWALDEMFQAGHVGGVRLLEVDTPSHGYSIPGWPSQMAAQSWMFKRIYKTPMPHRYDNKLVFSTKGQPNLLLGDISPAIDQFPRLAREIAQNPQVLADPTSEASAKAVKDVRSSNLLAALSQSTDWRTFTDSLRRKFDKNPDLDADQILGEMGRTWRFIEGTHTGVLDSLDVPSILRRWPGR